MRYKNLIFDADHTLINYTADERDALKRIFEEIGLKFSDKMLDRCCYLSEFTWTETGLYDVKNERIQREYHNLYKTHLDLLFTRIFTEFPCSFSPIRAGELLLKYLKDGTNSISHAEETIKKLKTEKGYNIYIATNGLIDIQVGRLKRFAPYLDGLFISEELKEIKPNPLFFKKILERLNCTVKECLMIGDSLLSDIAGADGVGMDSCWFNPKSKENQSGTKPRYEIKDLTDLLQIL
ncbi:MAG: HAD family hydrolase [Clostridiales bacterium]|nr:HAD family hydrolase [Clostridiales bacterium]